MQGKKEKEQETKIARNEFDPQYGGEGGGGGRGTAARKWGSKRPIDVFWEQRPRGLGHYFIIPYKGMDVVLFLEQLSSNS